MMAPIAWIAASAAGEPAAAVPHPPDAGATASLPQGQWGDPGELALPLADRGLLLADGLFETVLLEEGRLQLLEEHLERWRSSAELLRRSIVTFTNFRRKPASFRLNAIPDQRLHQ